MYQSESKVLKGECMEGWMVGNVYIYTKYDDGMYNANYPATDFFFSS